ncbi:MAG TPA: DUF6049 family protein, partial [Actinomycetota bacterium]|nr:DUF6049 family protein [Actinomycetota bacterium]
TVEKPLSEIGFFRSAPDRVYPVRITVQSSSGAAKPIDSHMVFFAQPPEVPLQVALVIPLHSPSMYRRGTQPNVVTSSSLSSAMDDGRLDRIVAAIEKNPDTPISISPTGLLIDMVGDLSNGFEFMNKGRRQTIESTDLRSVGAAQFLERLKRLAGRPATKTIAAPYSAAYLPGLVRNNLAGRAQDQVAQGRRRIQDGLATAPLEEWLVPSYGPLDERTLSEIRRTRVSRLLLDPQTVRAGSGPQLTPGLPVSLETRSGEVQGLLADPGLTSRFSQPEGVGPVEARQRFLAETATILLEAPARERAVAAVAPLTWSPSQDLAEIIITALGSAPWLKLSTPDAILAEFSDELVEQDLAPANVAREAGPEPPPAEYFLEIQNAQEAINDFAEMDPPQSRQALLAQRLLIAESADWWRSEEEVALGQSFAESVRPAVRSEFAKIDAPRRQAITLTSREGKIPLIIGSRLDYAVDVVVRLDSDKLSFPEGSEKKHRLQPRQQTLEVPTVAKASGTFPVLVRIETPDGTQIASSNLDVRSTAFNVVAVAITTGAAIFLVGWWMVGLARRRLTHRIA